MHHLTYQLFFVFLLFANANASSLCQPPFLNSELQNNSLFFVTNLGNNSNNGSYQHPWKTIQHAADHVKPGETVCIKEGIYTPFKITTSGTKNKPISFISEQAIIDGRLSEARDGISILDANNIIIRGFTVKYAKRGGITAIKCDNIKIVHNKTIKNNVWGIFSGFCDNLLIDNNTTAYSKNEHGIYVSNTSVNPIVSNNRVFANGAGGIQLNGDRHMGGIGIISNAKIYGNIVYNNGKKGAAAFNFDGVQYAEIYNNLLYDNYATGLALYQGDGGDGSKYNTVYNNTIVMPDNARWCALFINGSSHNTFVNNVCINHHKHHGAITIDKTSFVGFKSDYNALTPIFTFDDGKTTLNMSQWKNQTGNDINSISVNSISELFNYKLKHFVPHKSSRLINSGDAKISSSNDILGNKRNKTPDIGAYESSP